MAWRYARVRTYTDLAAHVRAMRSEAFLVGMITSFFDIEVVMLAFLATCVAVAALALIACLVRRFGGCGPRPAPAGPARKEIEAAATLCHAPCAVQPGVDITSWGTLLAVPGLVLIALVFIGIFWINRIFFLVIAGACTCPLPAAAGPWLVSAARVPVCILHQRNASAPPGSPAGVAALLSAAYLVYDLQLIMGGKTYAISPDEYIFVRRSCVCGGPAVEGAESGSATHAMLPHDRVLLVSSLVGVPQASLSVYLDIVQLFLWLLFLIGFSRES